MRRTKFPGGIQGNLHAAGGKCRSHTIKKTCGNRQSLGWFADVRWRDESVALPDTLEGTGQPGRLPQVQESRQFDRLLEDRGK
jgi:hypothetical protein